MTRFRHPALAAAATARLDVVSTAELLAADVSEDQIRHLVAIGFLHRVHRGVYAVGRPALSQAGRHRAAWLACGEASAVSHDSALADWNLARGSGWVHVSSRNARPRRGLVIHRPRALRVEDIVERDGYVVTSVARTILDLAPRRPSTGSGSCCTRPACRACSILTTSGRPSNATPTTSAGASSRPRWPSRWW